MILPIFRPLYDLSSKNKSHPRANEKLQYRDRMILYNYIIAEQYFLIKIIFLRGLYLRIEYIYISIIRAII